MTSPIEGAPPQVVATRRRRKTARERIYPRIDVELAHRVAKHAAANAITENAIVEAALREYLDRTSDAALLFRRLDRNARALARAERDLAFLSEAFATFVKLWFAHTPAVAEDARAAARVTAEQRYRKWLDHVVAQFTGGHRFVNDLPQEIVSDEEELAAVANATPTAGA